MYRGNLFCLTFLRMSKQSPLDPFVTACTSHLLLLEPLLTGLTTIIQRIGDTVPEIPRKP